MSLSALLTDIALNYETSKRESIKDHKMAIALRRDLPNILGDILQDNWNRDYIEGSPGKMNNWAEVPWCAIFNPVITDRATEGYFVVYLFNAKDKKIYLSLNQGTSSVRTEFGTKSYIGVLNKRAAEYREKLTEFEGIIPLTAINDFYGKNATGYAAGHILGFEYDAFNMPDDDTLIRDLQKILEVYSVLFFKNTNTDEDDSFKYEEDENLTASKDIDDKAKIIMEKRTYRCQNAIERNTRYADKVKKVHGLQCECCNLDFGKQYGEIGEGFIEVHHMIPLSSLTPESYKAYNIEKDFAVLCPNCHRMIHRLPDPSDLETLKKLTKIRFPKESSKTR